MCRNNLEIRNMKTLGMCLLLAAVAVGAASIVVKPATALAGVHCTTQCIGNICYTNCY